MSMSANPDGKGRPRSSHLSPPSIALSPTWGPPKSPLPPHRLAKLANALGVSTPMPAVHNPTPFMSRSYSDLPSPLDSYRRSPTPSTPASSHNFNSYSPAVSKYLLHVIPPLDLPHESDDDTDMTPPPATASGYHTQFRRGTLVPVHATLQSQLGAIAREYALPSTAGLILYLVSSARSPTPGTTPQADPADEPGPRLSEDIWKHLWTRVMKTEQRDDGLLLPSRSHTPNIFTLATGAQSTPFLPQDPNGQPPLRSFISTTGTDLPQPQPGTYPRATSPSTPSSSSDLRSNTKSAPPSSSSVSHSDPETPDTSSASHSFINDPVMRANSLDLPGLSSPSIIPILAKVEFDIDRRRAAWYDPWLRSRRMNYAKRSESRAGRKGSFNDTGEGSEGSRERHIPIDFLTGQKRTASPVALVVSPAEDESAGSDQGLEVTSGPEPVSDAEPEFDMEPETVGYEALPEPQEESSWSEDSDSDGEEFADEFTARATSLGGTDPLADVFGSDAETWAGIQSSPRRMSKRQTNPNVVELALSGADLTALPSPTQSEFDNLGKEEEEVQALLDQMSRPQLSVSIPPSPPNKRSSSPSAKKHVPPPLVLVPQSSQNDLVVPPEPSPLPSSAGSIGLAYLNDSSPNDSPGNGELTENQDDDDEFETDYTRVRSPAESDKRGGAVFDTLDLGLDPTEEFDDDDPHDRRRSQYLMKAQLDEIERTLAQLSPRMLQTDLAEEQNSYMSTFSPNNSISLSPGKFNGEFFPPSPRLPQHPEELDQESNRDSSEPKKQAAWPAVPFSSLNDPILSSPPRRSDAPPSPPRLAVNGVTTSAPKSYLANPRMSMSEMSAETESRKRELEEERGYPALTPTVGRNAVLPVDSPVIPLSPDPFGRFSSTPSAPTGSRQSSAYWDSDPNAAPIPMVISDSNESAPPREHDRNRSNSTATSRFSADSLTGIDPNPKSSRSALIAVNTIKKLWRKSNKNPSISGIPPTPTSGSFPSQPPPPRPSQEILDAPPKTPIFGRFSPQLAPPRPSQELSVPQPQQQPQQLSIPQQQHQQPSPIPQQQPPQHHPTMSQSQQLPIPFNGRSSHPSPIVAAQMRPGRGGSTLDRLHFDQESPYPTRRAQYSPRPPSPPNLPPSQAPNLAPPDIPSSSASPSSMLPPPDKEKSSVRKSILKSWKSAAASVSQAPPPIPEPRSSTERPNANGATRGRRPSVLNFGSTRSSVVSPPPEIPPSPPIPHQYVTPRNDRRQSARSRMTSSSIDSSHSPPQVGRTLSARSNSPQRSMASSRDSGETRPSFDTSQFEIVSPKMNSTLSYPYHGLDHD